MTDLLFIELGAVVTEVLGPTRCTVEPFCDPEDPPTYAPEDRVEVDFAQSLDHVLSIHGPKGVAQHARYDQVVAPNGTSRVPIGPSWPGGGHEGIVSVREDVVQGNGVLAAAANALAGARCTYQVIVSVDPNSTVRRYHGFPAKYLRNEGAAIVFEIANRDGEIAYDPNAPGAAERFYAGDLVEGNVLRGGLAPGSTGAVFMNLAALTSLVGVDEELPKLPPSAGL